VFTRRTVITFESLERSSSRLHNEEGEVGFCQRCHREVTWLTPTQTVTLTGLTLRQIFRRIETDEVHFHETSAGLLLICPQGLVTPSAQIMKH
jgi:hypothetical protein